MLWFYPTAIRTVLHETSNRLSELVHPRMLITASEVFDEVLRVKIQADLDVEIFNFYGAVELGRIAAECPVHEGLHVNVDHVILECLDGLQPVAYEKLGVSVVTCLNNFAMPFIRYRLGDLFTFLEKPCSCGSSFPLISSPLGREADVIELPSGKVLPPVGFPVIMRSFNGINQFRLIQESYEHLVLELVFQKPPPEPLLAHLRSQLMEYLGEPVKLEIRIVDVIEEEKLKFRSFISKLSKDNRSMLL